jgi:hypothetical protein
MGISDFLNVCGSALIAVFLVLIVIALVMRLIILLFPKKEDNEDSAVLAAIASTVSKLYPNSQITNIEEVK